MLRMTTYCVIGALASNALAQQQTANPFAYRPEARPHVIVDQTHDYLFVVYHLAYFLHEKGMLGAHSDRTLTWELIRNCDVVVTHQGHNDVPYTAPEIEMLRRFVARGGGLLLIGNNAAHARRIANRKSQKLSVKFDDLPLNTLAAEFGLRFTETPARQPFVIQANPCAPELTGETIAFLNPTGFQLGSFGTVDSLHDQAVEVWLKDASGPRGRGQGVPGRNEGAAVLAATSCGDGRVAALGGVDFIKTIDAPTKEVFFEGLFLWLGENSPKRNEMAGPGFAKIFPGIQLHYGHDYELEFSLAGLGSRYRGRAPFIWPEYQEIIAGVTVLYNQATKAEARRIMERAFPRVREKLTEIYGRGPRGQIADRVIHFFCNAGGGYAWNRPFTNEPIVGLPGLSEEAEIPAWKIGTIQHELTHAWGLPLGLSGHSLMSFNSIDLAEKLPEMAEWLEKEWARQLARLREADPDLKRIDLAASPDYRESPTDRRRWHKWNWTFRQLRTKYGPGYFARVISLAERDDCSVEEDPPALVYYLCLAAEENLYPWFGEHGTTVEQRPLPPTFPIARIDED
ncbi:MAG: hypothetical protein ACE5I3_00070 [Phycisphaerae bacterium]